MTIRLGFTLIGDGRWSGGLNYQRTLLQLLAGPLAEKIDACVLVAPEHEDLARRTFGTLLRHPLVVDSRVAGAGLGARAAKALATGCDRVFAKLVTEKNIDVVFEHARFFGSAFPVPILSWMPDFQHRHLTHLFSRYAWWRRELGYRAQGLGRRVVLLSSDAAQRDCEAFYPRTRGRTAVARFSGEVDLEAVRARARFAPAAYSLPARFFYLPNHFWAHKNHALVAEALRKIRRHRGNLEGFPPVVMSGPIHDHRAPGLFESTIDVAAAEGLTPWFRHIGLIDYGDVLALSAAADAVINPSHFEGWASSVEEAKSLGTPMVLSDIDVHREQAPSARFFGPRDASALAVHLVELAEKPDRQRVDTALLAAANAERVEAFAQAFGAAVEAAHSLAGVKPAAGFGGRAA